MRRTVFEVGSLIAVPLVLILCLLLKVEHTAAVSTLVVALALVPFVVGLERSNLRPKNLMPIIVLAALAVVGRIIFAPLPGIKPVSALVIIAGVLFGRRTGFFVGLFAALISNLFFGQGPWTLWQMYAWGLMGYVAGALAEQGVLGGRVSVMMYGALAPLGFGLIMDSYYYLGFVGEQSLASAALAYGIGLVTSLPHAVATVGFLALIYLPWVKKLERIRKKYGISP
ncbi:MAG: ECF transporter S component [Coriobacteriia bacterium]|nr:ECF transporter S component [Coriobacteriia bacterium]